MHGRGTFAHTDGSEYTGTFHGDQKHGYGVLTKADGTEKRGGWTENVLTDEGALPQDFAHDSEHQPRQQDQAAAEDVPQQAEDQAQPAQD